GDKRRPEVADRVPALDAARVVELDRARAGELADVGACREGALGAAEDDAPDRLVAVELAQLRDELVHQLVGERVQLLRPVQQADGDRLVALDEDEVGHRADLDSRGGGAGAPPPRLSTYGV